MPTGSGLWHFLYCLVRKFIRSVVSSEKDVATTVTTYRLCVNGDMENWVHVVSLLGTSSRGCRWDQ